ncbi:uncharacterized protein LOC120355044 [Nilaparvata lugens]|uniref:uncharacterized protein LOC120355044 n=1 Tax=Nilaparvata lugens TaxID=108931 RepID=UPI00193D5335|nr:uncharacterized protein LOC120355044 [Nilaparvata lugens]
MLCFGGNKPILISEFYPPIDTRDDEEGNNGGWELGLLSFTCNNSIPNVENGFNNRLEFLTKKPQQKRSNSTTTTTADRLELTHDEILGIGMVDSYSLWNLPSKTSPSIGGEEKEKEKEEGGKKEKVTKNKEQDESSTGGEQWQSIFLPEGSFEFQTIKDLLESRLKEHGVKLELALDPSTMKCSFKCDCQLRFSSDDSIGKLLGVKSNRIIKPNLEAKSDDALKLDRPNVVRVLCDIVHGSFTNGVQDHVLYEFYPIIDPGYKIAIIANTVVYLPVDSKRISSITLQIVDESGRLVNFRNEQINITLHLIKQQ